MLNSLQLALCEMQAKLFELSVDRQYDSENFVKEYMNSKQHILIKKKKLLIILK